MRLPLRGVAVGAATLAMLTSACSDDSSGPGVAAPDIELVSSLEQFDSCDELQSWSQDELATRVGPYGFDEPVPDMLEDEMLVEDGAAEDLDTSSEEAEGEANAGDGSASQDAAQPEASEGFADAEGDDAGADESAGADRSDAAAADEAPDAADAPSSDIQDSDSPEYSETNVQVEGIDEPDIVKTDGDRILAVANGQLHLASPDGAEVLDTVDLPDDLYDGEMMLSGDRVVLFGGATYEVFDSGDPPVVADGSTTSDDAAPDIAGPIGFAGTSVAQVDIDGDDLELTETFSLEGSYISARMIGDVVRLVMHTNGNDRIPFVQPGGASEDAEAQAAEVNQSLVENADPEDFLPGWTRLDDAGEVEDEGTLLSCEQAHAPEDFAGFGMVSVVTIDISDGVASGIDSSGGAGVMADGDTVYASHENLYVASPEWVDWDALEDEDAAREASRNYGTDIHRFDISDPTQADYDLSGRVDGWLLNQFALDEHDGRLRVATTTGSPWGGDEDQSESHVSVLEPDDGALVEVGSVSGLGKGESIYSVRFMGDVGYVVTFRETDPLYTIDLSDPTDPEEKGELKILGYSAYLHPIDDGWLLGVGQDATEEGWREGTQVSLFDVRDLDNPERVAQETLPNADSAAEWDHRAFLWWAESQLAAIPVSTYDWENDDSFEGLVGFTVDIDAQEISELGRISHPEQQDDWGYDEPIPLPEPRGGGVDDFDVEIDEIAPIEPTGWTPPIMRSWIIGDEIWTLSGEGLGFTDLETFEDTEFIDFPDS